ncbi:hypothetical protein OAM54_02840 [Pelagibacteraceae bacterium]|nr:hypothetical protein [Pelagibacteraceae bacterium]
MKTFRIKTKKLIPFLVLLGVFLTPVFTFQEVSSFLSGSVQIRSSSNIFIKLIKDFIFILVILVSLLQVIQNKSIRINKLFLLIGYTIFISFVLSFILSDNLITIIAGLRFIIPFILILALKNYIDLKTQIKISKILLFLFILTFMLQVYQLFYMKHFWGANPFGLSLRNPGIFAQNNTMAFFSLITLYYNISFENSKTIRKIIFILVPISILLTSSGTGLVVLVIFYMYQLYLKIKKGYSRLVSVFLFSTIFIGCLLYLPTLINRKAIYESLFTRLNIVYNNFDFKNFLFSTDFGHATNTGIMLNSKFGFDNMNFYMPDSTISALLANVGLLSTVLIYYTIYYVKINSERYYFFVIVFVFFSFTAVIPESYPMNLLFATNIVYFLKYKHNLKESSRNIRLV